jgi:hypothetical protein
MDVDAGRFGFIGLGNMGRPMATRLIEAGHQLTVYDTRGEAIERLTGIGATAAASPAEVARRTDAVFLSLPDSKVVEPVILGEDGVLAGSKGLTKNNFPTRARRSSPAAVLIVCYVVSQPESGWKQPMMTEVAACQCPGCQAGADHPDRALHRQMNVLLSRLEEPQRRWYAALEASRIGVGGDRLVSQITGLDEKTIRRGRAEMTGELTEVPVKRQRRPGGGRPKAEKKIR